MTEAIKCMESGLNAAKKFDYDTAIGSYRKAAKIFEDGGDKEKAAICFSRVKFFQNRLKTVNSTPRGRRLHQKRVQKFSIY